MDPWGMQFFWRVLATVAAFFGIVYLARRRRQRRRKLVRPRVVNLPFPEGIFTRFTGRGGFTIIEALIVVVIVGILAAIAIPKFVPRKAPVSQEEVRYKEYMELDLEALVLAQRDYFDEHLTYASDTGLRQRGVQDPIVGFLPRPGVKIVTIGSPQGWSATASHVGTRRTCAIFVGVSPVAPAVRNGVVGCAEGVVKK